VIQRHLAWTIAGLVVGGIAAFVAVGAAAAGHGTDLPATLLFPFTMLLAAPVGTIDPLLATENPGPVV
jgi:hypothetical protein